MRKKYSYHKFCRINRHLPDTLRSKYSEEIMGVRADQTTAEFAELYADCFANHVTDKALELTDALHYEKQSDRPAFSMDNLTARFLAAYYQPPTLYATANTDAADLGRHAKAFNPFVEEVVHQPITTRRADEIELGSNRISYLIGEIGIGKSVLISRLLLALYRGESSDWATVVPVYFDFESSWMHLPGASDPLRDIDEEFWQKLARRFYDSAKRKHSRDPTLKLQEFASCLAANGPRQYIKDLAFHLKQHGFRFLLILDNIDRYFFSY